MVDLLAEHIHISEREVGAWNDCTWCAGLEWYRLCYAPGRPATHDEAIKIRAASGEPDTGGSNLGDLARGIRARYKTVIPERITGYNALRSALKPDYAAVAQGTMRVFGPNHRLSKYDRSFDGTHAVLLVNDGGTILWCDPEAPTNAAVPVEVSWEEVRQFVSAFNGEHVVAKIITPPKEDTVEPIVSYLPGSIATIKADSNIRAEARIASVKYRQVGKAGEKQTIIGTVKGDKDPGNDHSDIWFMWWANGRYEYTAKDNVVSVAVPGVSDEYTKATQDAAVAAQMAADTLILNDAVGKAAGIATAAERERIAKAEADRVRNL